MLDKELNVIAKSFNEVSYNEDSKISNEALEIYYSLLEIINQSFEDNSPENYNLYNILMILYFDTSDNGNIVLEVIFISKKLNKLNLSYFML
ncbi:hypothetical protein SU69_08685 [Thermosipho melanesiensis]|uniref:Uncharacterized protein n=2 Tax=Thermosipho melanesiensis TaxID=46541 RepID=A6LNQ6_THEM4|nr:hypothetical protein [Thermosipho melanesiensis]ABR31557.1 hypothetical protein Tmel_1718 [Thermosipho melanesiensis BI429]APT74947.1 hypothetical protein BW47_09060 [Thermosipho melanesiensis]OOC35297.1 hypothetical protein SU69_08685 [Thermosipho melanesiensis]OOC35516.1 hypothetical protein SU70_08695 [Thermosipho melanesiensis]OOC36552.1 hypothetical protein SU68_08750 [Thermosipho melanesiensis]